MARGQPWWPQAQVTVDVLMQELGDDLAGVYVHGSAALGGWVSTSDLDVLAVVEDTAHTNWHALGVSDTYWRPRGAGSGDVGRDNEVEHASHSAVAVSRARCTGVGQSCARCRARRDKTS